ncbi:CheR family methyltransferase [Spirulina subsalsa]|uniref:CheR family methyltransferase n=1 Tax=Spirulina subsalsa TaxID=54311 RepID=UPI00036ACB6C|nr:CheR family methyltransferase [Spirulina subsalsa]
MPFSSDISSDLFTKFTDLVSHYTGIKVRSEDKTNFTRKLFQRMEQLKIYFLEDYYHFLLEHNVNAFQEWQELAVLLTNTESYFFRDQGQFSLLEKQIIPQLLRQNHHNRTLKIWSAGCSTGEEPYSLAILLDQLLPNRHQWNALVLGTDINYQALHRAREGLYSSWSFRMIKPHIQQEYFALHQQGYQIREDIRAFVRFEFLNLLQTSPNNKLEFSGDIDLIICRNVFIYFQPDAIAQVLKRFHKALKPGGYLLTGHAELYGQNMTGFQSHIFSESILYQKQPYSHSPREEILIPPLLPPPLITPITNPTPPNGYVVNPVNPPPPTQPPIISPQELLQQAHQLFQEKQYPLAIEKANQVLEKYPDNLLAYYLLAHIHANTGQYDQACYFCQQALEKDPLSVAFYYLLSHISEEKGDTEEAKYLYKRIIYLDPNAINAYYQLSHLYQQEGDQKRARKMYKTALNLQKQFSTPLTSPSHSLDSDLNQMSSSDFLTDTFLTNWSANLDPLNPEPSSLMDG